MSFSLILIGSVFRTYRVLKALPFFYAGFQIFILRGNTNMLVKILNFKNFNFGRSQK
jgi:hypothetical protein